VFAVEGAFDFLGPAAEPAVEDADAATLQGEDETAEADDDDDADEVDDLGGYEEGGSVAETCAVEAEPITQALVRVVFTAPGDRGTNPSRSSGVHRTRINGALQRMSATWMPRSFSSKAGG
jgi:hypothetical protein